MGIRLGVPLVLALVTSGCSGRAGAQELGGPDLAQQVNDALTASKGRSPDKVECPGKLSAEKGSSTRCTLTDGATTYGVTVMVSGERKPDGKVPLDIQVDQQPQP